MGNILATLSMLRCQMDFLKPGIVEFQADWKAAWQPGEPALSTSKSDVLPASFSHGHLYYSSSARWNELGHSNTVLSEWHLNLSPRSQWTQMGSPCCQEHCCLCPSRLCSPADPSGSSVAKRSNLSGLLASFQSEMSFLRHNLFIWLNIVVKKATAGVVRAAFPVVWLGSIFCSLAEQDCVKQLKLCLQQSRRGKSLRLWSIHPCILQLRSEDVCFGFSCS